MLLSIKNPIIVFTNIGDDVRKVREKNNLSDSIPFKIINMSINELEVVKNFLPKIEQVMKNSKSQPPEAEIEHRSYSPALYALYHAKPEMVAISAKLNPFQTKKFVWSDFGALRNYGGIENKP